MGITTIRDFIVSLENPRFVFIYDYLDTEVWTDYNQLCEAVNMDAIEREDTRGRERKNYKGMPSRTRNAIKFLIKINCLEVHPEKGVRLNKDYNPIV